MSRSRSERSVDSQLSHDSRASRDNDSLRSEDSSGEKNEESYDEFCDDKENANSEVEDKHS